MLVSSTWAGFSLHRALLRSHLKSHFSKREIPTKTWPNRQRTTLLLGVFPVVKLLMARVKLSLSTSHADVHPRRRLNNPKTKQQSSERNCNQNIRKE